MLGRTENKLLNRKVRELMKESKRKMDEKFNEKEV